MKNGAQEVYACASHGLLSEGAKATLEMRQLRKLVLLTLFIRQQTANQQP